VIDVQTVNIAKSGQQIIKKQVANYIQEIKVFIQTDPFLQNASIKSVEATKITKGGLTKAYTLTTNAAHLWQVMLDVGEEIERRWHSKQPLL
jgi:hypothetical protein